MLSILVILILSINAKHATFGPMRLFARSFQKGSSIFASATFVLSKDTQLPVEEFDFDNEMKNALHTHLGNRPLVPNAQVFDPFQLADILYLFYCQFALTGTVTTAIQQY